MLLVDRTIVITGGTSGIGKELVNLLSGQCKEIIVLGRNSHSLDSVKKRFGNVSCYKCNIDNQNELETIVHQTIRNHPEISLVINNAGIQHVPKFLDDEFNFEGIEVEVRTNLIAPIWIVGLYLGHFMESKIETGFVNVTSGLAIYPKTTSSVYCATKAGLRSFSKSFRYQMEGTNTSVFEAIMPIVDTPMTRGRGRMKMSAEDAARALISGIEAGKDEIYIGISRLIPLLSRISPKLMSKILKRA